MKKHDKMDTEAKLRERIKELTCLYQVVHLAERLDASFEELLQGIAELLPPAWQYPDIAVGRILLDGRTYCTSGFEETSLRQAADIVVGGETRGSVEVFYLEERPALYEGPFLKEERHLIDALAREISGIVERRQAREKTAKLEGQLRHADRLATLGQLAAGVAHELNEPLGNILGFAQLTQKIEGLPEPVYKDIKKIVDACLHARAIVNKLRIFARQMPAQTKEIDLNEIVTEGLFFIESRCAKKGIEIRRELDPDLPLITADPGQILQVLTNLTVNAVQAMPSGGQMTIRTGTGDKGVILEVEDTGMGMSPELQEKIFLPFFTTKDVDQGTGLGLAVVQGIISAHRGRIKVKSRLGKGSRFSVRLPLNGGDKNGYA